MHFRGNHFNSNLRKEPQQHTMLPLPSVEGCTIPVFWCLSLSLDPAEPPLSPSSPPPQHCAAHLPAGRRSHLVAVRTSCSLPSLATRDQGTKNVSATWTPAQHWLQSAGGASWWVLWVSSHTLPAASFTTCCTNPPYRALTINYPLLTNVKARFRLSAS